MPEFISAMQRGAAQVFYRVHLQATMCQQVTADGKARERARTSTPPFKIGAKASLRPADAALAQTMSVELLQTHRRARGEGERWSNAHVEEGGAIREASLGGAALSREVLQQHVS